MSAEYLHRPDGEIVDGIVLSHGAGSNANSTLLVVLAKALCETGYLVLRIDLAFRQARPSGPPHPSMAERDRAGIAEAAARLRELGASRVILGGHSYGGRQSAMLAAADPQVCEALLLLSYPLHPPKKPEELRTAHFPALRTPALFVHGVRDPFGTPAEMALALALIPARHKMLEVAGAGHELVQVARKPSEYATTIRDEIGALLS